MEFDSEEEAYNFYSEYAKAIGFDIRMHHIHKDANGRIIDRTFCCDCQGRRVKDKRDVSAKSYHPKTRTGCRAMMKINGRYTEKYKISNFIADHNGHDLVSPSKTQFLRSHKCITDIQVLQADDVSSSGIAPKAGYYLMSKWVDVNVGFIFEDHKNYLRSKRTMEMKGDIWKTTKNHPYRLRCNNGKSFDYDMA
ncbi:UNVERIFIED_CONTAM: protein FAR1-RELATED SEQUENCE 4 [Sesamum calycinum]|uniref:Protein FAR1-RELATED SEQUENCE 4 n=1 Tax=Sesamum calycinum TaxID=2727403 RepID=A0AAW2RRL0_9LAMI